ncbi:hemolysin expression modulating protein [Gemella sp. ND 6198]|uniref:DUF1648 domain-containing protein n=1 Tax=Gemella sp. ND 6198 TaxID=2040624 RepID=UPI000E0C8DF7|nr:DUF1648 domain-containing protein [Gemella sp. ND 6198]AXI26265.1 hemolysin expression modulating protein [Gemella sp. ND 6198]
MNKVDKNFLFISIIICLLPITVGLYFYNILPDKIVVHFDYHGVPDKYINKGLGVIMLPIFCSIIQIAMALSIDLSKTAKKGAYLLKSIIPIISIIFQISLIIYAINNNFEVVKLVIFVIGILFMIIGNYMPKQEWWGSYRLNLFGLEKKVNKDKVIRSYAKLTMFGGLVIFISGFLKTEISICLVIIFAVVSVVYPFYLAKKLQMNN